MYVYVYTTVRYHARSSALRLEKQKKRDLAETQASVLYHILAHRSPSFHRQRRAVFVSVGVHPPRREVARGERYREPIVRVFGIS